MNTYADKVPETKVKDAAASRPKQQVSGEAAVQFTDNRPEAIARRKMSETVNNSPRVQQLKAFQALANNSPQTVQLKTIQKKADDHVVPVIQKRANNTGLPDQLKTGVESLSGLNMDDVKVHYNSDKPAQVQAHAYAQGADIHVAPGQEQHLPHEAWHVVQQKQGRVKPTLQMKGQVNINDDSGLETEADVMGEKAVQLRAEPHQRLHEVLAVSSLYQPIQLVKLFMIDADKYRLAKDDDDKAHVTDTSTLSKVKQAEIIGKDFVDLKTLAALNQTIRDLNIKTDKLTKDELNARNLRLFAIEQILIGFQSQIKGAPKDSISQAYHDVMVSTVIEFAKISAKKEIINSADSNLDISVSAGDIGVYRDELREMGTFASLAEANTIADILKIQAPIFVLRNGIFREIDTVGRAHHRVGLWALVHTENHYEVVRGNLEGQVRTLETEWLTTSKQGDCLFESMLLISKDGVRKATPALTLERIGELRNETAAQMSDEDITISIQEMIMYGNNGKVGKGTSELIQGKREKAGLLDKIDKAGPQAVHSLVEHFNKLLKNDENIGMEKHVAYVEKLSKDYLEERFKSPSSEESIKKYKAFEKECGVFLAENKGFRPAKSLAVSPGSLQDMLFDKFWNDKLIGLKDAAETANTGVKPKARSGRSTKKVLEVGQDLLAKLANKKGTDSGQLKLYRGMWAEEAMAIVNWFKAGNNVVAEAEVLKGTFEEASYHAVPGESSSGLVMPIGYRSGVNKGTHLGNIEQAQKYSQREGEYLVEFTLKKGAEELLFSPKYMAILTTSGATVDIPKILAAKGEDEQYEKAKGGEGSQTGYIGLKSEAGDEKFKANFSIAIAGAIQSRLLFQFFVEKVVVKEK